MEMTIGTGPAPVEVEITPAEYSVELEAKETFIKGDKGDDGYTPIKGIDYFDGKDGYTPVKGVDYFDGVDGQNGRDGQDGYTPRKGIDYFDGQNGKDGYTPVKGVDYFDGQNGKDGKDGSDYVITQADYQAIADLVPVPEEIFSCTYGVTSYEEIDEAYKSGKHIIMQYPYRKDCSLSGIGTDYYAFSDVYTTVTLFQCTCYKRTPKSVWTVQTVTLSQSGHTHSEYALATAIPTDDHINSLIDAKLGVIENGTY